MHLDELLTIKGKNLTPINSLKGNRISYTFPTPLVGTFTLSGLLTEGTVAPITGAWLFLLYKQDNTYIQLSWRPEIVGQILSVTATTTADNPFVRISTRGSTYLTSGDLCNIMLNEGSTAQPYEPYMGEFKSIGNIWERAIPTESTKGTTTTFNNSRKAINLFDHSKSEAKWIGTNGAFSPASTSEGIIIPVEQGATYYFTEDFTNVEGNSRYGALALYDENKNFISGTRQIVTNPDSNNKIKLNVTINNADVKYAAFARYINAPNWMMIRKNDSDATYYPSFSVTKVLPSLKVFGGQVQEIQPKLWGRYKPVEYLESSGTQYIDIGVAFDNKTKAEVVWASTGTPTTTPAGFIGSRGSGASNLHVAINYGNDGLLASDFTTSSYSTYRASYTTTLEKKYRVVTSAELRAIYDADSNELKASNTTLNTETFTCDKNAYLFKSNGASGLCLGRMYSAKVWNDGSLQRNFVPVKDTVDNVYGMFDTVEEKFYSNSGTGVFTGGEEIKRVEYIESSGTQWVNTAIYLNGDCHKAEVEYEFDSSIEAASRTLFGAQSNQNLMTLYSGSGYACGDSTIGTTGRITSSIYTPGHHTVSFEMANNKAIYILDNGIPKEVTISASTFVDERLANNYQVALCANNNGGNHNQTYNGKIYKFKFWKQGNLIRHFIPILLGTEYAMLDLVEWKVYRNAGTGALTGGSEIPARLLNPYILKGNLGNIRYGYDDGEGIPSEYERVEYINNGSTGYIVTDIYPSGTDKIYVKASTTDGLTANQAIFGNYHDGANTKDFVGYFGKDHFYIWKNGNQQNFTATPQANVIYEFTADYLNGSATVKGGSVNETITFTPTTFTCSNKLPLGCRYNNGYGGVFAYNFYSVKYYRNNELIGDFVPVKKVSNNEYGMYDTVSNKFFGNSGTGTFTGGNVIGRKIITDGNHKTFIGSQGCIDMGTLNWSRYTGGNDNTYSCTINDKYKAQKTMSCSKEYTVAVGGSANTLNDKEMIGSSTTYSVYIRDNRYTDAASFKAAVSGKYLFYRREDDAEFISPTITEVTDILPSATSYFDEQTGTFYKDWAIKVLDGSGVWTEYSTYYQLTMDDRKRAVPTDVVCNYFNVLSSGSHNWKGTISGSNSTGNLWFSPVEHSSMNNFKAWLKEKYDEGNPVIVIYPLATPTTEQKTVTPISLVTKGSKIITAEAEIPTSAQATVLSK